MTDTTRILIPIAPTNPASVAGPSTLPVPPATGVPTAAAAPARRAADFPAIGLADRVPGAAKKPGPRPFWNERFFPFRGNWHLPFIVQRYFATSKSGFTPRRVGNALLAVTEMFCGRPQVRSKPFVLRIEPTDTCNLRCPRCSCGIGTDPRPKGMMSVEDFRTVMEQVRDHVVLVRLDGNGEPTLNRNLFEMVRIAKSYNFSVSISSNFNTRLAAHAEEIVTSGLDRLIVAMDGTKQESYVRYRVGGKLEVVEQNLVQVLEARRRLGSRTPFIEVQFLDWGYNHDEIAEMRRRVRAWGADKLEIITPDYAVVHAKAGARPRRCYWLWGVLTIDWNLNYKSCTNAWTLEWPRLNVRNIPVAGWWNHQLMQEARKFNVDKSSEVIAGDPGCHCNSCSDMLVVDRPPGYVCE